MPATTKTKSFNVSSFRYDPLKSAGTTVGRSYTPASESLPKDASPTESTACPVTVSPTESDYPTSPSQRSTFLSPLTKKRVTPHQWAVYDLALSIPCGKVTTYKEIALALGSGSPRSVGSALRDNPFAPYVPCHRVVASNMFVGGFFGEWADLDKGKKTKKNAGGGVVDEKEDEMRMKRIEEEGSKLHPGIERNWHLKFRGGKGSGATQREKIRLLAMEGVPFSKEGKLMGGEEFVWRPSKSKARD